MIIGNLLDFYLYAPASDRFQLHVNCSFFQIFFNYHTAHASHRSPRFSINRLIRDSTYAGMIRGQGGSLNCRSERFLMPFPNKRAMRIINLFGVSQSGNKICKKGTNTKECSGTSRGSTARQGMKMNIEKVSNMRDL